MVRHMTADEGVSAQIVGPRGFPLELSTHAVPDYLARARRKLDELESAISMPALKLLTGMLIAEERRDPVSALSMLTEVQAVAQAIGSDLAVAHAALAWAITHPTPEYSERRIVVARDVLETADMHADLDLQYAGYLVLLVALLEAGDIRSLDMELLEKRARNAARVREETVHPTAWFDCLRSILDGDIELAESHAEALRAMQEQLEGDQDASAQTESLALYITHLGMIRWMEGRIDGAEDLFLRARRAYPEQCLWPASLAWLWLLQGRTASAEAIMRSLPPPDEIPRDRYWLSTMTVLAQIATIFGTRSRADELRVILTPFADRLVPVGVGVAFWGTVSRTLGLLEEQLGLREEARQHLELAIETSSRIGALAWHAEAQIELALFAIRHDLTDVNPYELLSQARAACESRGFHMLARRAQAQPRLRVLGRFEVISVTGVRAEWNSRKARELCKMLIAARGVPTSREVFMEVLWPGEPPSKLGNRFSVAINVIRRALDPHRMHPTQHMLVTEGDAVRFELDHIDVDLERFLVCAERDDVASAQLARSLYRGDAFAEEPYADWAVAVRDHAKRVWHRMQLAGEAQVSL